MDRIRINNIWWVLVALALFSFVSCQNGSSQESDSDEDPQETNRTTRSIGNIARLLLGGNVPPDHPLVKYPDPIYSVSSVPNKLIAAVPGLNGARPAIPATIQNQQPATSGAEPVPAISYPQNLQGGAYPPVQNNYLGPQPSFNSPNQVIPPQQPSQWVQPNNFQQYPAVAFQAPATVPNFQANSPAFNPQSNTFNSAPNTFGPVANSYQTPANAFNAAVGSSGAPSQDSRGYLPPPGPPNGPAAAPAAATYPANGNSYNAPGGHNQYQFQAPSAGSFHAAPPQQPNYVNGQHNQAPPSPPYQTQTPQAFSSGPGNSNSGSVNSYSGPSNNYHVSGNSHLNPLPSYISPVTSNHIPQNSYSGSSGQSVPYNGYNHNQAAHGYNSPSQSFSPIANNYNNGPSSSYIQPISSYTDASYNPPPPPPSGHNHKAPSYSPPPIPPSGHNQNSPSYNSPPSGYNTPPISYNSQNSPSSSYNTPAPVWSNPPSSHSHNTAPNSYNSPPSNYHSTPPNNYPSQISNYPPPSSSSNSGSSSDHYKEPYRREQSNSRYPPQKSSYDYKSPGYNKNTHSYSSSNSKVLVAAPKHPYSSREQQSSGSNERTKSKTISYASNVSKGDYRSTSPNYDSYKNTDYNSPSKSYGSSKAKYSSSEPYRSTKGSYDSIRDRDRDRDRDSKKSEYKMTSSRPPTYRSTTRAPKYDYDTRKKPYRPVKDEYRRDSSTRPPTQALKVTYKVPTSSYESSTSKYSDYKSPKSTYSHSLSSYESSRGNHYNNKQREDGSYRTPTSIYSSPIRNYSPHSSYQSEAQRMSNNYNRQAQSSKYSDPPSKKYLVDGSRRTGKPLLVNKPKHPISRPSSSQRIRGGRATNGYLDGFKPLKVARSSPVEKYADSPIDNEGLPKVSPNIVPSVAVFHTSFV